MTIDYLNSIPNDIIYYIAIEYLSLTDVLKLCQTCKRFNNLIYNNENFWRNRCKKDLNYVNETMTEKYYKGSWLDLYRGYLNIWSFGHNTCAKLGLIDLNDHYYPTCIPNFAVKNVSAGENHTVFLDIDNNVWVCGDNQYGQLGLDYNMDFGISDVILKHFWVAFKKMRIRNKIPRWDLPSLEQTLLPYNFKAIDISAGRNYTAFIDLDNNVWTFGHNNRGQLGGRKNRPDEGKAPSRIG